MLEDIIKTILPEVASSQGISSAQTNSVSWSPDGKYLAAGENGGLLPGAHLLVLTFDRDKSELTVISSILVTSSEIFEVRAVDWHPGSNVIAVVDQEYNVSIDEFDPLTHTLKLQTMVTSKPTSAVELEWSLDGRYIAVADVGADALLIYRYDAVEETLTQVINQSLTAPFDVSWSPDGQFVSVAASAGLVV